MFLMSVESLRESVVPGGDATKQTGPDNPAGTGTDRKRVKKLYLQRPRQHTREDPCHLTPGSPVGRCFRLEGGGGGHDGRGVGDMGGGAVLPLLDPPRADCGAGRAVMSLILFGGWRGCCGPDPMAAPRPTRRAIWHCGHRRAVNPSLLRVSPLSASACSQLYPFFMTNPSRSVCNVFPVCSLLPATIMPTTRIPHHPGVPAGVTLRSSEAAGPEPRFR